MVRGSSQVFLVNTQVSRCGLHGVSAVHGGLVQADGCAVHSNTLSGINSIGNGSCVRCTHCNVYGNEDGGFNVVNGALALTSFSTVALNRYVWMSLMGFKHW